MGRGAHQLRLTTIFWRPANLNLARLSASCDCEVIISRKLRYLKRIYFVSKHSWAAARSCQSRHLFCVCSESANDAQQQDMACREP